MGGRRKIQDSEYEELLNETRYLAQARMLAESTDEEDPITEVGSLSHEVDYTPLVESNEATEDDGKKSLNEYASEKKRQRKERKMAITRLGFDQTLIDLNDRIPREDMRYLVQNTSKGLYGMVNKYEVSANFRIGGALLPHIPNTLVREQKRYPESVRMCPGFIYKTSKRFGSVSFWATPRVPYYLEQGSESILIHSLSPEKVEGIDRAVNIYNIYKKLFDKRTSFIASKLVYENVKTYYELLKLNPIWFEILYQKELRYGGHKEN